MIDISYMKELIDSKDVVRLASYMKTNGLSVSGNKIVGSTESISQAGEYWDKRQLVRKILLNSALTPSALV